jgi:CBS domain-containing protein
MTQIEPSISAGSWLAPSWEHATVADAMAGPVLSCTPATPLVAVARLMATRHVHAVVVSTSGGDPHDWRLVGDRELLAAGGQALARTAGDVATQPREAAEPDWPLDRAARLMADHGVSHLVVVGARGEPVGMLSTLDLAGVIAWSRG